MYGTTLLIWQHHNKDKIHNVSVYGRMIRFLLICTVSWQIAASAQNRNFSGVEFWGGRRSGLFVLFCLSKFNLDSFLETLMQVQRPADQIGLDNTKCPRAQEPTEKQHLNVLLKYFKFRRETSSGSCCSVTTGASGFIPTDPRTHGGLSSYQYWSLFTLFSTKIKGYMQFWGMWVNLQKKGDWLLSVVSEFCFLVFLLVIYASGAFCPCCILQCLQKNYTLFKRQNKRRRGMKVVWQFELIKSFINPQVDKTVDIKIRVLLVSTVQTY